MNMLERLWFRFTHGGTDIREANGGNPVDPIVIRYKDIFFEILLDAETGDPTGDFGWSHDSGMFHAPVREHLIAKPQAGDGEANDPAPHYTSVTTSDVKSVTSERYKAEFVDDGEGAT